MRTLLLAIFTTGMLTTSALAIDPALIERAKKEGVVSYYSTRQLNTMRSMAAAFKAKYGIELQYSKHSNEDLARKIISEYSAKVPTADVFDGSTSFSALVKADVLDSYKPEEAKDFSSDTKAEDGTWTAMNIYVSGIAYNSDLVKPADVAKKLDDLLDPKWKGRKIVYGAAYSPSGILGLIGGIAETSGLDDARKFLVKLKPQDSVGLDASPVAAADALAAGQFALCIGCLNQHIQRAKERGAPVEFMNDIPPIVTFFSHMGLVKGQKHPNAARLFVEWAMSEEGQALAEGEFYVGSRPNMKGPYENLKPSSGLFKAITVTPKMILTDMPSWQKLYDEVLLH